MVSLAAGIGLSRALHLDGAGPPEDELGESGIDCRNVTALFTQFISNTATAVLMAPIVLQAATALAVSPQPMLVAVAIAASTAFTTPIASPVNTLVLGPGGYIHERRYDDAG